MQAGDAGGLGVVDEDEGAAVPAGGADSEGEVGVEVGAGAGAGGESGGPGAAFAFEPLARDDVGVGGGVVDHAPAGLGFGRLRFRHHRLEPDAFFRLEPDAAA